jgi:hypothetical protein
MNDFFSGFFLTILFTIFIVVPVLYILGYNEGQEFIQQYVVKEGYAVYEENAETGNPVWTLTCPTK